MPGTVPPHSSLHPPAAVDRWDTGAVRGGSPTLRHRSSSRGGRNSGGNNVLGHRERMRSSGVDLNSESPTRRRRRKSGTFKGAFPLRGRLTTTRRSREHLWSSKALVARGTDAVTDTADCVCANPPPLAHCPASSAISAGDVVLNEHPPKPLCQSNSPPLTSRGAPSVCSSHGMSSTIVTARTAVDGEPTSGLTPSTATTMKAMLHQVTPHGLITRTSPGGLEDLSVVMRTNSVGGSDIRLPLSSVFSSTLPGGRRDGPTEASEPHGESWPGVGTDTVTSPGWCSATHSAYTSLLSPYGSQSKLQLSTTVPMVWLLQDETPREHSTSIAPEAPRVGMPTPITTSRAPNVSQSPSTSQQSPRSPQQVGPSMAPPPATSNGSADGARDALLEEAQPPSTLHAGSNPSGVPQVFGVSFCSISATSGTGFNCSGHSHLHGASLGPLTSANASMSTSMAKSCATQCAGASSVGGTECVAPEQGFLSSPLHTCDSTVRKVEMVAADVPPLLPPQPEVTAAVLTATETIARYEGENESATPSNVQLDAPGPTAPAGPSGVPSAELPVFIAARAVAGAVPCRPPARPCRVVLSSSPTVSASSALPWEPRPSAAAAEESRCSSSCELSLAPCPPPPRSGSSRHSSVKSGGSSMVSESPATPAMDPQVSPSRLPPSHKFRRDRLRGLAMTLSSEQLRRVQEVPEVKWLQETEGPQPPPQPLGYSSPSGSHNTQPGAAASLLNYRPTTDDAFIAAPRAPQNHGNRTGASFREPPYEVEEALHMGPTARHAYKLDMRSALRSVVAALENRTTDLNVHASAAGRDGHKDLGRPRGGVPQTTLTVPHTTTKATAMGPGVSPLPTVLHGGHGGHHPYHHDHGYNDDDEDDVLLLYF